MSNMNQHSDRGTDGKLLRSYHRSSGVPFPRGTPKWWRKLHMSRPRRRENTVACIRIMKGDDPDGMAFPLGNRKPHVYYW